MSRCVTVSQRPGRSSLDCPDNKFMTGVSKRKDDQTVITCCSSDKSDVETALKNVFNMSNQNKFVWLVLLALLIVLALGKNLVLIIVALVGFVVVTKTDLLHDLL